VQMITSTGLHVLILVRFLITKKFPFNSNMLLMQSERPEPHLVTQLISILAPLQLNLQSIPVLTSGINNPNLSRLMIHQLSLGLPMECMRHI